MWNNWSMYTDLWCIMTIGTINNLYLVIEKILCNPFDGRDVHYGFDICLLSPHIFAVGCCYFVTVLFYITSHTTGNKSKLSCLTADLHGVGRTLHIFSEKKTNSMSRFIASMDHLFHYIFSVWHVSKEILVQLL